MLVTIKLILEIISVALAVLASVMKFRSRKRRKPRMSRFRSR